MAQPIVNLFVIVWIATGTYGIRSTWLWQHRLPGPIVISTPPTTPPVVLSTVRTVKVPAVVGKPEKLPIPQQQREHPNSVYRTPGVLPPKTLPVPIAPLSAPTLQLKRRQAIENRTVFTFEALDCRHPRELSSVPVA